MSDQQPYLTRGQVLSTLGVTERQLVSILIARDQIRQAAIDRSPGLAVFASVPNEVPADAVLYGLPVTQGPAGILLRAE